MAEAVIAFCTGFSTIVRVGRDAPRWQRRRLLGPVESWWRDGAGSQGHAGLDPMPASSAPTTVHVAPIEAENSGVGVDPIARWMVAGRKQRRAMPALKHRRGQGRRGQRQNNAAAHASIKGVRQRQDGNRGSDQDARDLDAWNRQRFLSVRLQRRAARAPRIGTGPGTAAL